MKYYMLLFLYLLCSSVLHYSSEIEDCGCSQRSVLVRRILTVRGNCIPSPKRVVYRHPAGGFANNMMGLVTSYVFAMLLDAELYCTAIRFSLL